MSHTPVRLSHYDPRWPQEFEQTRSGILHSCGGLVTAVEHIGGTAISGLISRPTIDLLAASAEEAAVAPATLLLEGLNYRPVDSPDWAEGAVTLQKPRHGEATHRVHLMGAETPPWRLAIRIRDRLRMDREIAIRFEDAKVRRWKASGGDPERYEAGKAIFFTHLLEQMANSELPEDGD